MRFISKVTGHSEVRRLMIHDCREGVYLFIFEIEEDGGCSADLCFETINEAMDTAKYNYGVCPSDWKEIPDPLEHCQQDWIAPVRVIGREMGNPQWGKFEMLKNGKWMKIKG